MLDIQPPEMGNLIQQLAQQFTSTMTVVLTTIDSTVVELARLAYVSVLMMASCFASPTSRGGWVRT